MKVNKINLLPADSGPDKESLFDHCHWLYTFFRERVFRDHTVEITKSIFPAQGPTDGTQVLELGCGPGFYACRLAKMYPKIVTTGVDLSTRLIERARSRALELRLINCTFYHGDACALADLTGSFDAVIASRLFLIIPDREAVLAEVFRVLKPSGRCFLAEPTSSLRARIPLWAMKFMMVFNGNLLRRDLAAREAAVMSRQAFDALINSQPWASVEMHREGCYQYAVCCKDGGAAYMPSIVEQKQQVNNRSAA